MTTINENAADLTTANDESLKKVMSPKEYVSDSLGMASINVINIMTSQLTYFYTNMAGMAPGLAGTVLMIPRIFDAISDIIMGRVFDRSNDPEGKVKPWFRRMLVLLPLSIILLFLVPKASPMIQGGYAVLTNILACAVCYTVVCIPYTALFNYRTKNTEEKGKMGVYRQIASYAVGYGITITLMPVTTALGGNQRAWIIYALFFTILSFVCLFISYKGIKERYVEEGESAEEEKNISTMQSIGILMRNSYWVKLTVICLLITIVYAMVNSAPIYYFQYVFGNANLHHRSGCFRSRICCHTHDDQASRNGQYCQMCLPYFCCRSAAARSASYKPDCSICFKCSPDDRSCCSYSSCPCPGYELCRV